MSACEKFFLALYGAQPSVNSLDKHRHLCYLKADACLPVCKEMQLTSLTPT